MPTRRTEPGSFRDRNGAVFYDDGAVLRGLGAGALEEWRALAASRFFRRGVAGGTIVATEEVPAAGLADAPWAGVLRHETVPFISYPYEWCFGMLRDAALLQLDLLEAALGEGMTLKDASAFNVQWHGSAPVFIDIPSFRRLRAGEPWVGYRQFCEMFLYPLFLQAYRDVAFQPWLRGHIDGIAAEDFRRLMSLRDLLRPGVFTHGYLHPRLQERYGGTERDVREELRAAGFGTQLIQSNVRRLRKVVGGLGWRRSTSTWSDYVRDKRYSDADQATKVDFVRDVIATRRRRLVWDLGCNTGTFATIAAENADYVVAFDRDQLAVERFYRTLRASGNRSILPLVNDLADPSPGLGWRGIERKTLVERGRPELVLCLALVHHMVITANIPLVEVVGWLADLGSELVIEFVTRDDPMVQTLLRGKDEDSPDYDLGPFEERLAADFDIARRTPLASGTRLLYHARPRARA